MLVESGNALYIKRFLQEPDVRRYLLDAGCIHELT